MKEDKASGRKTGFSMPFEKTKAQINVLRRHLHIISLLQHTPENNETWNASSLADLMNLCPEDKDVSSETIRKYYSTINDEFDEYSVNLATSKGSKSSYMNEKLTKEAQLELAELYSVFTIKDITRDLILKRFIEAKHDDALWTIARLFFASKEKKPVSFDYTANDGQSRRFELAPYYMIIYNNNMYLIGKVLTEDKIYTLIADRIKNLTVLDKKINYSVQPPEELFAHSLSTFLPKGLVPTVKIRYKKHIKNSVESIIGKLSPVYTEEENHITAEFQIADYQYLFKTLFPYGKDAEIISPKNIREEMKISLRNCLSVYKD